MSGLLEVFVSDTGRAAPRSRMAACCDCAFALFGTVWCCVDYVVLCGPVWSNCVCYVYGPTVQHARALAGPVSALDGTTTFLVKA